METISKEKNRIIGIVNDREQMTVEQESDAEAEKKSGIGQAAESNGMEEGSGSLLKVETRLKERRGSYGNVGEMLEKEREMRGGEKRENVKRYSVEVRKRQNHPAGRGKKRET